MTRIRGSLKIISPVEVSGIDASPIITTETTQSVQYWTCSGINFIPHHPDTETMSFSVDFGSLYLNATTDGVTASVILPHKATVVAAVVYGIDIGEVWSLVRKQINVNATVMTMATAVLGTEDTTIVNPIIDNSVYSYHFKVVNLDAADRIHGARITYTL